ncbi:MAG: helix-turn-helix domain-containing protein [Propioniciclava sp.]|uniref:helix-turn-helix domain-containing protein n=1 Tax=Propioniciclava sp. TaxID=2038686 RepID=UPI0039E6D058
MTTIATRTLLTVAEAAELMRVPVNTLYAFRHQGKGPLSAKVGRRVVYREADVLAWLDAQFAAEEAARARRDGEVSR